MSKNFDAIVIGSGMGGLSAASVLSLLGKKRVLVLERHFKLGGLTHTFSRNGYTWDVGLHYVGDLREDRPLRKLFDLITRSKLKWQKMPEDFEVFNFPNFQFKVPSHPDPYQSRLVELFPEERAAIGEYFEDVRKCSNWVQQELTIVFSPGPVSWMLSKANAPLRKLALTPTSQYLQQRFKDERLRSLLTSQWGDIGLTPEQSAFGIHSLIVKHYFFGGYYPVGSSKSIAETIVPTITENGGQCLINHEVTEIIVENGTAVGVKALIGSWSASAEEQQTREEVEFRAPLIISDAGMQLTYENLLPAEYKPDFYDQLEKGDASCVTMYIAFKESPAKLGFQGENHWIFTQFDHEQVIKQSLPELIDNPRLIYLSFPSLKDPAAQKHTAEAITFVPFSSFDDWENTDWKKRGADYEELKGRICQSLLSAIEKRYPGFSELVDFVELSTPLTVKNFTAQKRGAIYGLPLTPSNIELRGFGPKTPVNNLLLAGADAVSLGIAGALLSGVVAAGYSLGTSTLLGLLTGNFKPEVTAAQLKPEPSSKQS